MKFINSNKFNPNDYAISAEEYYVKKLEQPKPVILDIRDMTVSSQGTAEAAHCLPEDQLEERMIQLPPFGTIILFSDKDDTHIEKSVKLLWENGFTDLFFVTGGYEAIVDALIETTDAANKNIQSHRDGIPGAVGFELRIKGFDYDLVAVNEIPNSDEYLTIPKSSVNIFLKRKSIRRAEGTQIDFDGNGLTVDHPRMHAERPTGDIKERINKVIDEMINPGIAAHGGIISLIDVKDDTLYIEMGGGCQGCGMSKITLKQGIEVAIKDHIPEIEYIYDVTDHAAGTNPYYKPE